MELILRIDLVSEEIETYIIQPLMLVPECFFA